MEVLEKAVVGPEPNDQIFIFDSLDCYTRQIINSLNVKNVNTQLSFVWWRAFNVLSRGSERIFCRTSSEA